MGLSGCMLIRESGIHRSLDTPSTTCASTIPNPTHTSPSSASNINSSTTVSVTEADADAADLSCPHCPRTFTSHIGLVSHLRIYRSETGQPLP
ncbi:hypothetical protein SprV_0802618000 [Sparganum proliferum]